jgi:hypothetical protein
MSYLDINIELDTDIIIESLITNSSVDELVDFVDELVDRTSDNNLINELYNVLKLKHNDWLEENGISKSNYEENIEDDEHWTSNDELEKDVEIDDDDSENPLDVFTTE